MASVPPTTYIPLMDIVKRQAIATFSKISSGVPSGFEENLSKLKHVMGKITSADVNLDPSLLQSKEFQPPVAYVEVMDDPDLTIGIFVLRQGARLPLHDHPLMYGILKVIHGTIRVQSYSTVIERKHMHSEDGDVKCDLLPSDISLTKETLNRQVIIMAKKEPAVVVSEADNVCVLSPTTGNLHEIRSVNGPAAFLDVLSPPYNTEIPGVGPRPCRYFKELDDEPVSDSVQDKTALKRLLRISCPSDYWSSSAPYQGP